MLWLRHLHVALAYITVVGFVARGLLSLVNSPARHRRWLRIAPHVVDTGLLACGVALAVQLHLDPLVHGWLAAKLVGLVAYIGFGVLAMRAQRSALKLAGFAGAIASVAYIFAVAYSKQVVPPWPL
jgi:uncharacterized membrane protein SirB2